MSNVNRIPLRRQWREDHPPQFGRSAKQAVAGVKIAKRRSFGLYKIEMLQPSKFRAMVEQALGKVGAKTDPDGQVIVNEKQLITLTESFGSPGVAP